MTLRLAALAVRRVLALPAVVLRRVARRAALRRALRVGYRAHEALRAAIAPLCGTALLHIVVRSHERGRADRRLHKLEHFAREGL